MARVVAGAQRALLALSLLAAAQVAAAAEAPVVSEGARVRVWQRLADPRLITGSVRALGGTAIVLQPRAGGASTASIAVEAVERVRVSVGQRTHARRGALVGVGALWGSTRALRVMRGCTS